MKRKVYLETSVISYLTSKSSQNSITTNRQLQARLLWERKRFAFVISDVVLDEISLGDKTQTESRLVLVEGLPVLPTNEEAQYLAQLLITRKALPNKAIADAFHVAIATFHRVTAIASYNFRHISGAFSRRLIENTLLQLGYSPPIIANPEELIGDEK